MHLLKILLFCFFFGVAFGTLIEVTVTVTCTLPPANAYKGTVQLMEYDRVSANDKLTGEVEFWKGEYYPSIGHKILLRGEETEMLFSVEPFLIFRHTCTPSRRRQEYQVDLTPCTISAKRCSEDVDVQLGKTSTYKLRNFQYEETRGGTYGSK